MINLCEALFILGLDDEEEVDPKTVITTLESVLAGAILAELFLQNRVRLVEDRVIVTDPTPTEHSILDKALFDIVDAGRPRKIKYWINTLIYKKFLDEIGHYLVEIGVLVRKKKRLHLLIPNSNSQNGNVSAKDNLKNRLREIVLAGKQPELTERILLAFLYHGELLKLAFPHGESKAAHKKVKKLITNDEEGICLGEPMDEIVAVACGLDH